MDTNERISVYGAFGFVLGEFCRQNPEEVLRVEKSVVEPPTSKILYGISTTDNYNVFDNPYVDIETNLLHLISVLEAAHKKFGNRFHFTFISSWFVYGQIEFPMVTNYPLHEEAHCNPKGFYSITKRAAEQLLISYCETFKISYTILRLANVLGYRDMKVSTKKNALQYLIDKIVHSEPVELYDRGEFWRDYIDVRDCARAIKLALGEQNKIINISNGTSYLFKDLIDMAVRLSGSKSLVVDKLHKPEFHAVVQSKDVFLSNEKLRALGYEQQFPMEQTIKDIVENYK